MPARRSTSPASRRRSPTASLWRKTRSQPDSRRSGSANWCESPDDGRNADDRHDSGSDPRAQARRSGAASPIRNTARAADRRRRDQRPPRAVSSLRSARASQPATAAVIAEVKKASPSRGVIRAELRSGRDRAQLCRRRRSVFIGVDGRPSSSKVTIVICVDARAATPIACAAQRLRRGSYQIAEARVLGADCILLIVAALEPD